MVKSICCTIMRAKVKIPAPIKQGSHDIPLILVESRGGNEDCRGLAYNLTKNTSPLFMERPYFKGLGRVKEEDIQNPSHHRQATNLLNQKKWMTQN